MTFLCSFVLFFTKFTRYGYEINTFWNLWKIIYKWIDVENSHWDYDSCLIELSFAGQHGINSEDTESDFFTVDEDSKIINFIIKNNQFSETGGIQIWGEMIRSGENTRNSCAGRQSIGEESVQWWELPFNLSGSEHSCQDSSTYDWNNWKWGETRQHEGLRLWLIQSCTEKWSKETCWVNS